MDRAQVMRWVSGYETAWWAGDAEAVTALFTPDAHYRASPYQPDVVGHAAIGADWVDPRPFTMNARPVAVDADTAVVHVLVRYDDPPQEYRDLWVLRFAGDGRVTDFEEWAYWPGKAYVDTDGASTDTDHPEGGAG